MTSEQAKLIGDADQHTYRFARRSFLGLIAAAFGGVAYPVLAAEPVIKVHKDPDCGCCSGWVQHLHDAGFTLEVDDASDLASVKRRLGVPPELEACHTAEVDRYILEGHVPAPAVRRLLADRPRALGLAVPGMPIGSPGMEGEQRQPYSVVLFGPTGQTTFMRFVGQQVIG